MMVMFLSGVCDLCGEARPMATPEQCKAAGLDLDAAVCVECARQANPAIVRTFEQIKADVIRHAKATAFHDPTDPNGNPRLPLRPKKKPS